MKEKKSTTVELVRELIQRNEQGRYNYLIVKAKSGMYHDFKSWVPAPKAVLVEDLHRFSELEDIRSAVIEGVYDEEADAEDLEDLRQQLPTEMWELLGL